MRRSKRSRTGHCFSAYKKGTYIGGRLTHQVQDANVEAELSSQRRDEAGLPRPRSSMQQVTPPVRNAPVHVPCAAAQKAREVVGDGFRHALGENYRV